MKVEEFVYNAVVMKIAFVPIASGACYSVHTKLLDRWTEARMLAELTEYIDYGCQFDSDGLCQRYRKTLELEKNDTVKFHTDKLLIRKNEGLSYGCCCDDCSTKMGYHYYLPCDNDILCKMASLFDEKRGFWRKGKGCILPREMRSPVCLTVNCSSISSHRKGRPITRPMTDEILSRLQQLTYLKDLGEKREVKNLGDEKIKQMIISELRRENNT